MNALHSATLQVIMLVYVLCADTSEAAVSPFNATPEFSVGYGKSLSSVTMVNSQDGFCFLAGVNGQLVQSGDSCSVVVSTEGPNSTWMLVRDGQTAPVSCNARCLLWSEPQYALDVTSEFSVGYGKSLSSVTMVNTQDGFCFLTDVKGQLVQIGDSCSVVMSTQGPDSEWMLTRNGQTAPVGCSARCALWNSTGFPHPMRQSMWIASNFNVAYGKQGGSQNLVSTADGVCYLSSLNGQLIVANGDSCTVTNESNARSDDQDWWILQRDGQTAPTECGAQCLLWNGTGLWCHMNGTAPDPALPCSTVTNCTANGTYSSVAPTATSDVVCNLTISNCSAPSPYVLTAIAPTLTSDRVCEKLPHAYWLALPFSGVEVSVTKGTTVSGGTESEVSSSWDQIATNTVSNGFTVGAGFSLYGVGVSASGSHSDTSSDSASSTIAQVFTTDFSTTTSISTTETFTGNGVNWQFMSLGL
jgi:hypothetical protein